MENISKIKEFNRVWKKIDRAYHDIAQKLGLSDSAMLILYAICNSGGECMLTEITQFSNLSKQTANSAIRKLEIEGLIYLELVGLRKKKVCLTEKGIAFTEKTVGRIIEIENEIYNSWLPEEWEMYLKLTERFLNDFKEKTKDI